jgi:AcrR family transcriptional regulator
MTTKTEEFRTVGVRSAATRERILAAAETLILERGFAATSIDDILAQAAITKGGFFYHFNGKKELARALVERYLEQDSRIFAMLFQQADALSEDPLHQLLIFLKLFADMMADLAVTHPGCLVASFTYESQQLDDDVRALIRHGVVVWREMISLRLEKILAKYPPSQPADVSTLADMFTSTVEGGILLSRIYHSNQPLVNQILQYRAHLRLVFGDL